MEKISYDRVFGELFSYPPSDRSARTAFELGRAGPLNETGTASDGLIMPIYGALKPFADIIGFYIAGAAMSTNRQSMKALAKTIKVVAHDKEQLGRGAPDDYEGLDKACYDLAVAMKIAFEIAASHFDAQAVMTLGELVTYIALPQSHFDAQAVMTLGGLIKYMNKIVRPSVVTVATHMRVANDAFMKALACMYTHIDMASRGSSFFPNESSFMLTAALRSLSAAVKIGECSGFWLSLAISDITPADLRQQALRVLGGILKTQISIEMSGREWVRPTKQMCCSVVRTQLIEHAHQLARGGDRREEAASMFALAASCSVGYECVEVLKEGAALNLFKLGAPLGALELALRVGDTPNDFLGVCGLIFPAYLTTRAVHMVATSTMYGKWGTKASMIVDWYNKHEYQIPPPPPSVIKVAVDCLKEEGTPLEKIHFGGEDTHFEEWSTIFGDGAAATILRGPAPDGKPWFDIDRKTNERSRAIVKGVAVTIARYFGAFSSACGKYVKARDAAGTSDVHHDHVAKMKQAIFDLRTPAWDIILMAQMPVFVPENVEVEQGFVQGKGGAMVVDKKAAAVAAKVAGGQEEGSGQHHVTLLWFMRNMSRILPSDDPLRLEITASIAMILAAVRCVNFGGAPLEPAAWLRAISATMRASYDPGHEAVTDAFESFSDLLQKIECAAGDGCQPCEIAAPFASAALLTHDIPDDLALFLKERLSKGASVGPFDEKLKEERQTVTAMLLCSRTATMDSYLDFANIAWLLRTFDSKVYFGDDVRAARIYAIGRLDLALGMATHAHHPAAMVAHLAARAAARIGADEGADDYEYEEDFEEEPSGSGWPTIGGGAWED